MKRVILILFLFALQLQAQESVTYLPGIFPVSQTRWIYEDNTVELKGIGWIKISASQPITRLDVYARNTSWGLISGPPTLRVTLTEDYPTEENVFFVNSSEARWINNVSRVQGETLYLHNLYDDYEVGVKDMNVKIDSVRLYFDAVQETGIDTLVGHSIRVTWDFEDSEPLTYGISATNLTTGGSEQAVNYVVEQGIFSSSAYTDFDSLSEGHWTICVTAHDTSGNQSGCGTGDTDFFLKFPVVIVVKDTIPPDAPKNVRRAVK